MLTVLNDVHIGVQRSAGTTPRSALDLRDFVINSFSKLVSEADDLCILGDLFDQYSIPNSDLLMTMHILQRHCAAGKKLYLVAGNHDLSKDSSRMSSFELLGRMMEAWFPEHAKLLMKPTMLEAGAYVIPHCVNQDRFNEALSEVPSEAQFILLHANYDNNFAEQQDHSLNVSEEQALKLLGEGNDDRCVVFAHEHQHRFALDQRVIVIGNQVPTSISDCLGPKQKYRLHIEETLGRRQVVLDPVLTISDVFEMRDWRELGAPPFDADTRFIRVAGEASANEAADVVSVIAKYRAKSDAFVITNAVKIAGAEGVDTLPESLESAKAFDVLGAILETLDEKERAVVKTLMET